MVGSGTAGIGPVGYGGVSMNKKQLMAFRSDVEEVLAERQALGNFDANSKYMVFLLGNMRNLIDHAISQCPKSEKRGKADGR